MIVEAYAALDTLHATLSAAEDRMISVERLHATRSGSLRSIFWVHGDAEASLAEVLLDDPTVTSVRELSKTEDAWLYRADHAASTDISETYAAAVANDIMILNAVGDAEGWLLKCWMPTRKCLSAFRDQCVSQGVELTIRSMYNDEPHSAGELYGLTEPQREILLLAAKTGYFQIPRDITLADLAARLGLSSQAASERLRRGMRTLVRNVLDGRRPLFNGIQDFERRK